MEHIRDMCETKQLLPPDEDFYSADAFDRIIFKHKNDSVGRLLMLLRSEIIELITEAPLAPSHGDFHGNNLILTEDGIKIIDFEFFYFRPWFIDLLNFPLTQPVTQRGKGTARKLLDIAFVDKFVADDLDSICASIGMKTYFSVAKSTFFAATIACDLIMRHYHPMWEGGVKLPAGFLLSADYIYGREKTL